MASSMLVTMQSSINEHLKYFYLNQPYLTGLSNAELEERLYGILDNLVKFSWDFNFLIEIKNNEMGLAFLDTITEFEIRGLSTKKLLQNAIDRYRSLKRNINIDQVNNVNKELYGRKVLFRYTENKYEDYWLSRKVWFNRSEEYDNKSLGKGISDDEMSITSQIEGLRVENISKGEILEVKNNRITATTCNYYISSYSLEFDPKLFVLLSDKYNICFAITNAEEYVNELCELIIKNEKPIEILSDKIEYIDEKRRFIGRKPLMLRKRYRYMFENEYRIAYYPVSAKKNMTIQIEKYNSKIIPIGLTK